MDEAVERGSLLDYLPDFMKQFLEIRGEYPKGA